MTVLCTSGGLEKRSETNGRDEEHAQSRQNRNDIPESVSAYRAAGSPSSEVASCRKPSGEEMRPMRRVKRNETGSDEHGDVPRLPRPSPTASDKHINIHLLH